MPLEPDDESPVDFDAPDPNALRVSVTELRPFAPSGAVAAEALFAGSKVVCTFAEASDGPWATARLTCFLHEQATLPLGAPVRVFGALDRSREYRGWPKFRVRRVENLAGERLWDAAPVAVIELLGHYQGYKLDLSRSRESGKRYEPVPGDMVPFFARELVYDDDLVDALEALDPDTKIAAWTCPDNTFDPVEMALFLSGNKRKLMEKRFLTLLEVGDQRLMANRRGTWALSNLRRFGVNPDPSFQSVVPIRAGDLRIRRIDPEDVGAVLACTDDWTGPLTALESLPAEMAAPMPKAMRRGLGILFPDPERLAPVSAVVTLTGPLQPVQDVRGDLLVWPWSREAISGEPFSHSLTIFELNGGIAALPVAQAAAAAGRLWIAGRIFNTGSRAFVERGDQRLLEKGEQLAFDGVSLYDGETEIAYANE
jgi:hypothetical protein